MVCVQYSLEEGSEREHSLGAYLERVHAWLPPYKRFHPDITAFDREKSGCFYFEKYFCNTADFSHQNRLDHLKISNSVYF